MSIEVTLRAKDGTTQPIKKTIDGDGAIDTPEEAKAALALAPQGQSENFAYEAAGKKYSYSQLKDIEAGKTSSSGELSHGKHRLVLQYNYQKLFGSVDAAAHGFHGGYFYRIPLTDSGKTVLDLGASLGILGVGDNTQVLPRTSFDTETGVESRTSSLSAIVSIQARAGITHYLNKFIGIGLEAGIGPAWLIGQLNLKRADPKVVSGEICSKNGLAGNDQGTSGCVPLDSNQTANQSTQEGTSQANVTFGGSAKLVIKPSKHVSLSLNGDVNRIEPAKVTAVGARVGVEFEFDHRTHTTPPPADRDGDGVPDSQDACPEVPGIETKDPKTNGCEPAKIGEVSADRTISNKDNQAYLKFKVKSPIDGTLSAQIWDQSGKILEGPDGKPYALELDPKAVKANQETDVTAKLPKNLPAGDYTIVYKVTDPTTGNQAIGKVKLKVIGDDPLNDKIKSIEISPKAIAVGGTYQALITSPHKSADLGQLSLIYRKQEGDLDKRGAVSGKEDIIGPVKTDEKGEYRNRKIELPKFIDEPGKYFVTAVITDKTGQKVEKTFEIQVKKSDPKVSVVGYEAVIVHRGSGKLPIAGNNFPNRVPGGKKISPWVVVKASEDVQNVQVVVTNPSNAESAYGIGNLTKDQATPIQIKHPNNNTRDDMLANTNGSVPGLYKFVIKSGDKKLGEGSINVVGGTRRIGTPPPRGRTLR